MMTQHKQTFPWGAVIWSSVLMVIIPLGAAIAISVGYGVVVGFQTRGDPEAINTAVMSLSGAVWYQALPKILLAAVAFWRGMRLAHSSASATLPVVSAAILALIGLVGTGLALQRAPPRRTDNLICGRWSYYAGVWTGRGPDRAAVMTQLPAGMAVQMK